MADIEKMIRKQVRLDQMTEMDCIEISGKYRDYNRRYREIVNRDLYGAKRQDDDTGTARGDS